MPDHPTPDTRGPDHPASDPQWLAERFEEHRGRLRAVAYRVLGSAAEAEDAVQETWLRLARDDRSDVQNLGGWLTTVVARVSLNMLRARDTRREDLLGESPAEPAGAPAGAGLRLAAPPDPEAEAVLADSVGLALLAVLDTLQPPERLAFVLHDLFDVPFDEIAPVVGRSPEAARQLASRARRRVRSVGAPEAPADDLLRRRRVVDAFRAASRDGDLATLVALLDPQAELRTDAAAAAMPGSAAMGPGARVRGGEAVAAFLSGKARAALPAVFEGAPALAWVLRGEPQVVFEFTFADDGRIAAITLVADRARLAAGDVVVGSRARSGPVTPDTAD